MGYMGIGEPFARPPERTDPRVGGDWSDEPVVVTALDLDGCVLRLANLRMSKLRRVAFVGCTIEDLDAHRAEFEDVSFDGSVLSSFSLARVAAERVDLRGCTTVGLRGVGRLDGLLVSEHQLLLSLRS